MDKKKTIRQVTPVPQSTQPLGVIAKENCYNNVNEIVKMQKAAHLHAFTKVLIIYVLQSSMLLLALLLLSTQVVTK